MRCTFSLSALAAFIVSAVAAPPSIELHPPSLDFSGPGERHRVLVTLIENGRRRDATREATFTSEQARVCTTTRSGEVHAAAFGETIVVVTVGGITSELPVTVANGSAAEPPSFVNEVIPLLTRLGCNRASCHGEASGQNGFRLSLFGQTPSLDYLWLTREHAARRTASLDADESLLLRKAMGRTPHAGNALVGPNGYEHALLRSWLEAGSPGPRSSEATARRLEVLPGPRSLRVGEEQQLLVRAEFAPGNWRDVTWLSRFETNQAGVTSVTAAGRVAAVRPGEAGIRATYQTASQFTSFIVSPLPSSDVPQLRKD